jgi:hypothetical protein
MRQKYGKFYADWRDAKTMEQRRLAAVPRLEGGDSFAAR